MGSSDSGTLTTVVASRYGLRQNVLAGVVFTCFGCRELFLAMVMAVTSVVTMPSN